MKILLLGEKYSSNLGDGVICETVEYKLKLQLNCEIISQDITFRYGYQKRKVKPFIPIRKKIGFFRRKVMYCIKHIGIGGVSKKRKHRSFVNRIEGLIKKEQPDVIIFAGGQLFMDTFLERIYTVVKIAEDRKIPIFFNACGCGNYLFSDDISYLTKICRSPAVKYISIRDGYDRIRKYITECNVNNTVDSALLCNEFYHITAIHKTKLGVGIMYSRYADPNVQIRFWSRILSGLLSEKRDFVVFCNGDPDDYEFIKYLILKVGANFEKNLADLPVTPEDLVNIISGFETIISMRLHSLIIAYSLKIPAIGVAWDKKVSDFYDIIDNYRYSVDFSTDLNGITNKLTELEFDNYYFHMYQKCIDDANKNFKCISAMINLNYDGDMDE